MIRNTYSPGFERRARFSFLRFVEMLCWFVGIAALGYFAYVQLDAHFFQQRELRRLAADRSVLIHVPGSTPAGAPAPAAPTPLASPAIAAGTVLGEITVPRIGLDVVAVEGDDDGTLSRAVGHIPGTAYPGTVGTVGFAAHRDTFFRRLGDVHAGDVISYESGDHMFLYRVISIQIVKPEDVQVLQAAAQPELTLVTCYPFHYIGPAPKRFVVTAALVPQASDPSSTKPEQPLRADAAPGAAPSTSP